MQPRAKIIKSFCFISKRGKLNPQVYWLRIKNRSKLTWCICRIFIVQKLWTTFTPRSASFRYNKKYSSLKSTIILLQLHIKHRVVTPSRLLTFFFCRFCLITRAFLDFFINLGMKKCEIEKNRAPFASYYNVTPAVLCQKETAIETDDRKCLGKHCIES